MELEINGISIKSNTFYGVEEAAKALGLSRATLATYRSRTPEGGKGLPFYKSGSRVYYSGSDLIAHLQGEKQLPGADPERSRRAKERRQFPARTS